MFERLGTSFFRAGELFKFKNDRIWRSFIAFFVCLLLNISLPLAENIKHFTTGGEEAFFKVKQALNMRKISNLKMENHKLINENKEHLYFYLDNDLVICINSPLAKPELGSFTSSRQITFFKDHLLIKRGYLSQQKISYKKLFKEENLDLNRVFFIEDAIWEVLRVDFFNYNENNKALNLLLFLSFTMLEKLLGMMLLFLVVYLFFEARVRNALTFRQKFVLIVYLLTFNWISQFMTTALNLKALSLVLYLVLFLKYQAMVTGVLLTQERRNNGV